MFDSLLFRSSADQPEVLSTDDPIFQDLALDNLFDAVNSLTGYDVKEFNYQPLTNDEDIKYRQETFNDFQNETIYQAFEKFTKQMSYACQQQRDLHKLDPQQYREHTLVTILDSQFDAIDHLLTELDEQPLNSKGLIQFVDYVKSYIDSDNVKKLRRSIDEINQAFSNIYYRLYVNGRAVVVEALPKPKESMNDSFEETFAPIFESIQDMDNPVKMDDLNSSYNMNNLQVSIITELVKLYPDQLSKLDDFYNQYANYSNLLIEKTVQELAFFLAWQKVERSIEDEFNLSFTLPTLIEDGPEQIDDSFDIDLVLKMMQGNKHPDVVTNQFILNPDKRFLVISGPNQGGKTTYARMVGQNFYLAKLGIAIAGIFAKIKTRKTIFTHLDRQESSDKLSGLLETDVERIHSIIEKTDSNSFVILNELFSSTSEEDASVLGNRVLKALNDRHASGIYVTFLESLGDNPYVQPLMSQVTKDAKRTFRVIPEDLNGKAYTDILLKKYQLSQSDIERELLQ